MNLKENKLRLICRKYVTEGGRCSSSLCTHRLPDHNPGINCFWEEARGCHTTCAYVKGLQENKGARTYVSFRNKTY